jgi:hypothetical protein
VRRWDADRDAYTQHIDWTASVGRRRTRQTPRQAAMLLRRLEEGTAILQAEEACDDSLRMIPYLLDGKAVSGGVIEITMDHWKMGRRRRVRRPLVTILSADTCLMPRGKRLWWTSAPDGSAYEVHQIHEAPGGGSTVILELSTGTRDVRMPRIGDTACFSIHKTAALWLTALPQAEPWTHRPTAPPSGAETLEEGET